MSFSQTIRGFARYIIYIRFGEGKIIDFSTINLQLFLPTRKFTKVWNSDIISHFIVFIILYYIILYHILLNYIILYYIILYLVFVVSAFWFEGVGAADHEEVLLRLGYHADVVLALRLKQLVGQMQ